MADEKKQSRTQAVLGLIILAAGAWYFFGGGMEQQAATDMGRIENQVAQDSIAQYRIVKASGSPADACVHSGIVSAAFLQAKDEAQYKAWKDIQKVDCQAAGMPEM